MSSQSASSRAGRAMQGGPSRLLLLMALGGLVAACARAVSRTHRRRLDNQVPALPHRLQTWESEGGRPLPEEHLSPDSPSPAVPAPPGG